VCACVRVGFGVGGCGAMGIERVNHRSAWVNHTQRAHLEQVDPVFMSEQVRCVDERVCIGCTKERAREKASDP
jgi:hypothetical protein